MPRNRPATSGYARLAQAEEEEEEQDMEFNNDPYIEHTYAASLPTTYYRPIQPPGRREPMRLQNDQSTPQRPRRRRTLSGVDLKSLNTRLERWAEEIKERLTRRRVKGKSAEDELLEIHHSVFQAPDWIRPASKDELKSFQDDIHDRMPKLEFDDLVESVRTAIELGVHPKLISQGSSGSYFAQNTAGKVVGVFKPKDEEPYATKNPKWTKWIHRNLFPFAFGRAMLIPNLSYVSEAAAYILDCQLRTNLVPYTDVISLSSKSFHYDWMDRRAYYRKHRPFPEKPGSFQVFLPGYKGATEFFRTHPWPDEHSNNLRDAPRRKRRKRWDDSCRPNTAPATVDGNESENEEEMTTSRERSRSRNEFWTEDLQQGFREELEKLVILDYVMRNTDRGTDNWMIRIDPKTGEASIAAKLPNGHLDAGQGYARRTESMSATQATGEGGDSVPRIGAIDNSLSWPWKHPDAWRSYPFGWLFLPVSLIGQPFSEKTRQHFLPLLTSKAWWSETQVKLRRCFEIDADFKEKMFARQIAVMKGQAWNVVETLKTPDHGPLELSRRNRVLVWDDLVEIPVAIPLSRASDGAAEPGDSNRKGIPTGSIRKTFGRRGEEVEEEQEEMDIVTALPSSRSQQTDDLLSPTVSFSLEQQQEPKTPNSSSSYQSDTAKNIFRRPEVQEVLKENLSSPTSADVGASSELKLSPTSLKSALIGVRPGMYRSRTGGHRLSQELPRPVTMRNSPGEHRRRFSLATLNFLSTDLEDDHAGDLGFATAADQESSMRKVIVERLEMVKSKPPVFSWC